jgi:hypothetical protein
MKILKRYAWIFGLVVLLVGCNFPGSQPAVIATPNVVETAAVLTVQAIRTQIAQGPTEVDQPTLAPTWTPPAEAEAPTATPTEEIEPTSTPWPTYTPLPTYTPYPTATATATAICNQMQFVKDVTIPDGTWMRPKQNFTKIWEVRNTGSCTWDAGYSVVYGDEGGMLGAAASHPLPSAPVRPGETVRIAVAFTAPDSDGTYTSAWRLRSTNGEKFGRVTVKIVADGNPDRFVFADKLCSAEWRSGAGIIPCPSEKNQANGYMFMTKEPKFENGAVDDEATIIMHPQKVNNGELAGYFFAIKMPASPAHFRTVIGCTYGHPGCDTYMAVFYRVDGTDTAYLVGDWDVKYDGVLKHIDVDLTSKGLENKIVHFSFLVRAKGNANDDEVFFLLPRIEVP